MAITVSTQSAPFTWGGCSQKFADVRVTYANAKTVTQQVLTITSDVAVGCKNRKPFSKSIKVRTRASSSRSDIFAVVHELQSKMGVGIKLNKRITRKVKSNISARSAFVPPAAVGVVSDIGILSGDIDFNTLLKKGSALGFSDWQQFNAGDYCYREALMRLNVNNSNKLRVNRVDVTEHMITCDVEDLVDKGTATVAKAATKVMFNRHFHAEPNVSVTILATSEFAVPKVTEITKDYFVVSLIKVDNTLTNGSVSWFAHGY